MCSAAYATVVMKCCDLMSNITRLCAEQVNIRLFSKLSPQLYLNDVYIHNNTFGFCQHYVGEIDFAVAQLEKNKWKIVIDTLYI